MTKVKDPDFITKAVFIAVAWLARSVLSVFGEKILVLISDKLIASSYFSNSTNTNLKMKSDCQCFKLVFVFDRPYST